MEAIYFKEVNVEIAKDQPQYKTLPAHVTDRGIMVTCFKLSPEEIKSVRQNGVIWVQVFKGAAPLQPLSILAVKDWFKQIEINDDGSYQITPDVHSSEMPKTLSKADIRKKIEDYNHNYYSAVANVKDQKTVENKYYEEYIDPMVDWIHSLQGAKAVDDGAVKPITSTNNSSKFKKGDTVRVLSVSPPELAEVLSSEYDNKESNCHIYKLKGSKGLEWIAAEYELSEPLKSPRGNILVDQTEQSDSVTKSQK